MFPKPTRTTRKNTKRGVTKEVNEAVRERDGGCVICWATYNLEPVCHHVFFGLEANYGPGRNEAQELCCLCRNCHYEIHHGTTGKGKEYREQCKLYLKNYYDR